MSLILSVEDFLKSLTQDIIIKIVMRTLASTKHIFMYLYVSIYKFVIYILLIFSLIYFGFEDLLFRNFFFL